MTKSTYTLDELNALSGAAFVEALGEVYEHSPWVIEAAAGRRPFASLAALQTACESALYAADESVQFELIRAHPDLAAKLEQIQALTDFSQQEQARAGFAALPEVTLDALRSALGAYRERFGHPFILCVTEHPAAEVLPILELRLASAPEAERLACLFQIARIGWHRICSLVSVESV